MRVIALSTVIYKDKIYKRGESFEVEKGEKLRGVKSVENAAGMRGLPSLDEGKGK